MNSHKLARLSPCGREVLVQRVPTGVPVTTVAREAGVSRQAVYTWCRRAEEKTPEALQDRASTPHHSPQRLARYRPGELVHLDIKTLGKIGRVGHGAESLGAGGKGNLDPPWPPRAPCLARIAVEVRMAKCGT